MRWPARFASLFAGAVLIWAASPGALRAQSTFGAPSMPNLGSLDLPSALTSPTGLGSLTTLPGQVAGSGPAPAAPSDPGISLTDTFVSIIDGAAPLNLFIVRFDAAYDIRQPTRAEYLFAKGGLPNSPGFPLVETKIDYQELSSHAEFAIVPWFSMFVEVPYRWLNPDVNANEHGFGDARYGFKLCTWSSDSFIATLQLRITQPIADPSTLGTGHWSVEPGLLAAYRINPSILVEGQLRYNAPIGGSDFAGDVVCYGLGISYGQRNPGGFWFMPVLEVVGWTVMNGQTILASSPTHYTIQDVHDVTIANAYLGLRVGYGANIDFYLGYGRAFTGDTWYRDFYRAEFRLTF